MEKIKVTRIGNHRLEGTLYKDEQGRVTAKYRSYPQGKDFSENWTEDDIKAFLRQSNDYYMVK